MWLHSPALLVPRKEQNGHAKVGDSSIIWELEQKGESVKGERREQTKEKKKKKKKESRVHEGERYVAKKEFKE